MLINNDMLEVISDIEIRTYVKLDEWPAWPGKLLFQAPIIKKEKYDFSSLTMSTDNRYKIPQFALWVAMHFPDIDPHDYLDDYNLPVLYNNGFITDFKSFEYLAIIPFYRGSVSIENLCIIIACRPDLCMSVFDKAVNYSKLEVIEWLFETQPSVRSVSHSVLMYKGASAAVMEFYYSKNTNWLSGAYDTIIQNINNPLLVYNDGVRWLMDKSGFDMLPHISANNGELIERLIIHTDCACSISVVKYIVDNFRDFIRSLAPERIESIGILIYTEYDEYEIKLFMDTIPEAKLPANILASNILSQELLQTWYNNGRISGDYESIKDRLFAYYEDDSWYDQ